ncbi:MAG TPA: DUF6714 family protein [Phototrophicaceae bacterium]|nr:DUF6714 family protein [Phototrophicaceae bacterium]
MRIETAFADAAYPGDENITNENHCDECYQVAQAFKGKHWRNLTDVKFINYHYDVLAFFKAPAFQFFLPAFLLVDLKQGTTAFILYALTPPEIISSSTDEWFEKFGESQFDNFKRTIAGFTPRQWAVIKEYLEYSRYYAITDFEDDLFKQAIAFWSVSE